MKLTKSFLFRLFENYFQLCFRGISLPAKPSWMHFTWKWDFIWFQEMPINARNDLWWRGFPVSEQIATVGFVIRAGISPISGVRSMPRAVDPTNSKVPVSQCRNWPRHTACRHRSLHPVSNASILTALCARPATNAIKAHLPINFSVTRGEFA